MSNITSIKLQQARMGLIHEIIWINETFIQIMWNELFIIKVNTINKLTKLLVKVKDFNLKSKSCYNLPSIACFLSYIQYNMFFIFIHCHSMQVKFKYKKNEYLPKIFSIQHNFNFWILSV